MKPLGVTQYRLAKETNVPPRRINEIVHGRRDVFGEKAGKMTAPSRSQRALVSAAKSGAARSGYRRKAK